MRLQMATPFLTRSSATSLVTLLAHLSRIPRDLSLLTTSSCSPFRSRSHTDCSAVSVVLQNLGFVDVDFLVVYSQSDVDVSAVLTENSSVVRVYFRHCCCGPSFHRSGVHEEVEQKHTQRTTLNDADRGNKILCHVTRHRRVNLRHGPTPSAIVRLWNVRLARSWFARR